jgi:presenilin-like A22 family membrane protease
MNVFAAIVLMVLLSMYDMYAVWQSKHMIKMAKFQTKSGIFAGVLLPYKMPKFSFKKKKKKTKPSLVRTAILGGGDIGFPLIFSGVILKTYGFHLSLVMPVAISISLLALLMLGKKKHFYPAIPFLTMGCLAGYFAVWLISLI